MTSRANKSWSAFLIATGLMFSASCSVKDAKTIDCGDPGRNPEHRLKIKVKPNGSPKDVVQDVLFGGTAKELHVCRGDTVIWKHKKKKAFIIGFEKDSDNSGKVDEEDSSFDWTEQNSSSKFEIIGTVRNDAVVGVKYDYSLTIPNTPEPKLDPIIIVDR